MHDGFNIDKYQKPNFEANFEKTLEITKENWQLYRILNQSIKCKHLSHLANLCSAKPMWDSQTSDENFFIALVILAIHIIVILDIFNSIYIKKLKKNSIAFLIKKIQYFGIEYIDTSK